MPVSPECRDSMRDWRRGSGPNRAIDAAKEALASPLLDVSASGSKGVLFNVVGGDNLSLFEVNQAAEVIRQAVDNFNLERTAGHILSLLGTFNKQWSLFIKSMERMGNRIDDARHEFDILLSTRRQQLERPLKQIEELRTEKGINIEMLTNETEETIEES